jgi:hypothetical protein
MAGYSGTPLAHKLGIKENFRITLANAPTDFADELSPLPSGAVILPPTRKPLDLILLFADKQSILKNSFPKLAARLAPNGMLWVTWPKKSSRVATDLTFDVVQELGLTAGLVDTKICAINEIWSGLRFVIRIKDRPRRN